MDFNEKLRKSMSENGPESAKKWAVILEKGRRNFNAEEYKNAENEVRKFHEIRKLNR